MLPARVKDLRHRRIAQARALQLVLFAQRYNHLGHLQCMLTRMRPSLPCATTDAVVSYARPSTITLGCLTAPSASRNSVANPRPTALGKNQVHRAERDGRQGAPEQARQLGRRRRPELVRPCISIASLAVGRRADLELAEASERRRSRARHDSVFPQDGAVAVDNDEGARRLQRVGAGEVAEGRVKVLESVRVDR